MPEESSEGINPILLSAFLGIFILALAADITDLIFEFVGILFPTHTMVPQFTKAISGVMDLGTTFVIGGWSYWTQKQSTKSKTVSGPSPEGKSKETAKSKTGKKIGGKIGKKIGGKIALKTGAAFVGELIPFVGAAPFWTLTVLSTFINVNKGK